MPVSNWYLKGQIQVNRYLYPRALSPATTYNVILHQINLLIALCWSLCFSKKKCFMLGKSSKSQPGLLAFCVGFLIKLIMISAVFNILSLSGRKRSSINCKLDIGPNDYMWFIDIVSALEQNCFWFLRFQTDISYNNSYFIIVYFVDWFSINGVIQTLWCWWQWKLLVSVFVCLWVMPNQWLDNKQTPGEKKENPSRMESK